MTAVQKTTWVGDDDDEDLNSPVIRKFLINEYCKNRKRIFKLNDKKSVENNKINIKKQKLFFFPRNFFFRADFSKFSCLCM